MPLSRLNAIPVSLRAWASALLVVVTLLAAGCVEAPAAEALPATADVAEPQVESATLPANPANPANAPTTAPTVAPTATIEPTAAPTDIPGPTQTPVPFGDVASGVPYRLPLVVQHVTETTAVLFFELHTAAPGLLIYWPEANPAEQHTVSLPADRSYHQVVLEGLQPGTSYAAIVGIGPEASNGEYREPSYRGELWGTVTFTTTANPVEWPLRVGVIGDSGFGEQVTFDLAQDMAASDLDFTVHTGDVVYQMYNEGDPFESYAFKWYQPLEAILERMPVYPVIGNHDVEESAIWEDVPFYYRVFPPFPDPAFEPSAYDGRNMWYAVAYGDVQFLLLDTQVFFSEGGRAEQEAWIAERLADLRFRITIPVMHVPPYSYGRHAGTGLTVRGWTTLYEGANVPLVLSGHDHNYERVTINGITYIISGGGSASLYPQTEDMPEGGVFIQQSHWVLLEIYEDRIEVQARGRDGTVLDRATIPLG